MCGIFALITSNNVGDNNRREFAFKQSTLQRHRGPDYTGVAETDHVILINERLSVIGIEDGNQPIYSVDQNIILVANCEIYNYMELQSQIDEAVAATSKGLASPRSDSEVILLAYELYRENCVKYLRGMFSFVIYDKKNREVFVARDPYGIEPLYVGYDYANNSIYFASELKSLSNCSSDVAVFPSGCYLKFFVDDMKNLKEFSLQSSMFNKYYSASWMKTIGTANVDYKILSTKLIESVKLHLHSDAPVALLISGGLDSSIIAGIAAQIVKNDTKQKLHSYCIGLENSPDLKYAGIVAKHINSHHHEVNFTIKEGIDYIRSVIWHLETYDVTTIRAGIPMFLLARRIRRDGFKVALSGEGSDEIFGGYLYFHRAPNAQEHYSETVNRLINISYADCLRANKACMAWGVELRVPFLYQDFVDYAMTIAPEYKMVGSNIDGKPQDIEKYILRKSFAGKNLIPDEILWRQKEQLSDGVGYSWIDILVKEASKHISDDEFANAAQTFEFNTPLTREAFYYRKIFRELFGIPSELTVKLWKPRADWDCDIDPSGRAQKVHKCSVK